MYMNRDTVKKILIKKKRYTVFLDGKIKYDINVHFPPN